MTACLTSLYTSTIIASCEVIVVDNGSSEGFDKILTKKFSEVIYYKSKKNNGFGAGNNYGASLAKGECLFFLNPDTELEKNTLKKLSDFLSTHKEAAIVSPILYHPDNTVFEKQGVSMLTPLTALFSTSLLHRLWPNNPIAKKYWNASWDKKTLREVDVVPGTALMIRREVFKSVGGFDEKFFLYFEEFDLCRKVRNLGRSLFMLPGTKVIHKWGVSTEQFKEKDTVFKNSQEYYFEKYYGVFMAKVLTFLLSINKYSLLFFLILLIGLFLRTNKITSLFMFIGDFGWFYLSAWDLLTKGIIPLVSIPSSVVWLHQGPLATYLIAFALYIGKMNPVAPALFFSLLDVITIFFVYRLGVKIGNQVTGVSAAFIYATSPLVLINVRMPYHTAPIPFFACIVFLILLSTIENKKSYFWLFFFSGLLLQLELSNGIILLIISSFLYLYRKNIAVTGKNIRQMIIGFVCGISPFILYDLTHNFTQTLGFPLWIINRVRLFLGLTSSGNGTTKNIPEALVSIWDHIARVLFPYSQLLIGLLVISFLIVIGRKILAERKSTLSNKALILMLLWIAIPCVSFIIHAAPGDAYFPFLFPVLSILAAYTISEIFRYKEIVIIVLVMILGITNAFVTITHDYFLYTFKSAYTIPPHGYGFGPAFFIQQDIASRIAADGKGKIIHIRMGGYQSTIKTGGDQFRYMLMEKGITLSSSAKQTYIIYESQKSIPANETIFYQNKYYYITKIISSN